MKIFIYLKPSKDCIDDLNKYCKENNITQNYNYNGSELNKNFDYHLTVFYTDHYEDNINFDTYNMKPVSMSVEKVDYIGDNIICLYLEKTKEIQDLFDAFKEFGLTTKFKDFKPHISLSYDKERYDKLKNYNKKIIFDKLVVEKSITVESIINEVFEKGFKVKGTKNPKVIIDPTKKDLLNNK